MILVCSSSPARQAPMNEVLFPKNFGPITITKLNARANFNDLAKVSVRSLQSIESEKHDNACADGNVH